MSVYTTSTFRAKKNEAILVRKKLASTALLEIAWVHGPLTMPYDATDVPESGVDHRTAGMKTTLTQSSSHSIWRNASILSAYGIKGSFSGS